MGKTINLTFELNPGARQWAEEAKREVKPAIEQALNEEVQLAFRDSQREVPVRTGTLKGSGATIPASTDGDIVSAGISYGGAASAYAAIIHDDRSREVYPSGGKPGFAEDPLKARAANFHKTLVRRIERALKK